MQTDTQRDKHTNRFTHKPKDNGDIRPQASRDRKEKKDEIY